MLVLFETAAGHALFKVTDESKLANAEEIHSHFSTSDKAASLVKLQAFNAFADTTEAVSAATDMVDNKIGKSLKKFLKKQCGEDASNVKLAVNDKALGGLIKEKLGVKCVHDKSITELMRGIRSNVETLVTGMADEDLKAMTLGLSHSLSRYKLKFSADKVDTMIIQAIGLLDELDKEINTYSMRTREWYGWHFPEMGKILTDNLTYVKVVKAIGMRSSDTHNVDFSSIIGDESVESTLKEAVEVSMGTEISQEDVDNISCLCDQVISLTAYRSQLWEYLKSRMAAIAPNLTVMVGELVGARLIAHAGSLMNLAKAPASTVQILGAEKALFRALKTKHDTPKYGLIYHASLIGQAAPKHKGKISRVLAAKTALACRVDALGDASEATIGYDNRAKCEARLRQLDSSFTPNTTTTPVKEKAYVAPADNSTYKADDDMQNVVVKSDKKKKKKRKAEQEEEVAVEETPKKLKTESTSASSAEKSLKKKKKKKSKD